MNKQVDGQKGIGALFCARGKRRCGSVKNVKYHKPLYRKSKTAKDLTRKNGTKKASCEHENFANGRQTDSQANRQLDGLIGKFMKLIFFPFLSIPFTKLALQAKDNGTSNNNKNNSKSNNSSNGDNLMLTLDIFLLDLEAVCKNCIKNNDYHRIKDYFWLREKQKIKMFLKNFEFQRA